MMSSSSLLLANDAAAAFSRFCKCNLLLPAAARLRKHITILGIIIRNCCSCCGFCANKLLQAFFHSIGPPREGHWLQGLQIVIFPRSTRKETLESRPFYTMVIFSKAFGHVTVFLGKNLNTAQRPFLLLV